MNPLYIVTAAMFGQMSMAYMASLVLPVVAPTIAADLGIDPALIGLYSGLIFFTAMLSVNAVGPLIERFGALRVGQSGLTVMGIGIALAAVGWLPTFAASAIVLAAGMSMCTPSSSHVVGQFCTPRQRPLFFSIKQTGVAIGGLIAGLVLPFLVEPLGWRGAVLVAGAMPAVLAFVMQPLRARVDTEPRIAGKFSVKGIFGTLRLVINDPALRRITVAGMTFVGLQSAYGSYLSTYLVNGLGHTLAIAGSVFAVANFSALGTRILWGVAAAWLPARWVLSALGLGMAVSAAVTGAYSASWPIVALMAGSALFGATAFSWQGVLFAEIARLAPEGKVGAATGGVMSFIYIAMMSFPLIYGAIFKLTGSYALGFYVLGAPSLASCVLLLLPSGQAGKTEAES